MTEVKMIQRSNIVNMSIAYRALYWISPDVIKGKGEMSCTDVGVSNFIYTYSNCCKNLY